MIVDMSHSLLLKNRICFENVYCFPRALALWQALSIVSAYILVILPAKAKKVLYADFYLQSLFVGGLAEGKSAYYGIAGLTF